ncbi:MAG: hypothetical protein IH948_00040 [Bacteroidetes bacterium]|nr:hypothetical protein [Bacteroidota bacterium]
MKFPKELHLSGETIKVKIVTQKQMNKMDKTRNSTWGRYFGEKREIYIVKLDDETHMWDTFWHEVGHWFLDHYSFRDSEINAQVFSDTVRTVMKQLK